MKQRILKIGKRLLLGFGVLFVGLVVIGMIFGESETLSLKQKELVLEFGEKLPENLNDYIETNNAIEDVKYSSEDIHDFKDVLDVGEYSIDFKIGSLTETLKVKVQDTTKPQLELSQEVVAFENNNIDYLNYVKINEKSKYTTSIDDHEVIYNKPGNYHAYLSVKDIYDNEDKLDIPVTIEEVKITPSQTNLTLDLTQSKVLSIDTNSNHSIIYQSNNPDVATVDNHGTIQAIGSGSAVISATVDGKTTKCEVTVKKPQKKSNTQSSTTQKKTESQSNTTNVGYTVYITNTGDKYHRGNCRYLRKSKIAIGIDNAISQGYDPCKVCRP